MAAVDHELADMRGKEYKNLEKLLEEKGIQAARGEMKKKLQKWEETEIEIGVTGCSGVGKSSFINFVRDKGDEDEGAAKVDVVEKTDEAERFHFKGKITFVDLPGIGSKKYPDLDTYSKNVELETYHTFLILTCTRFTDLELQLAQKIKSCGKSFFLVRTKIDIDEMNDKRKKNHDLEKMLKKIRDYVYKEVKDVEGISESDIFLISNVKGKYPEEKRFDFERLLCAIKSSLTREQKEALTRSVKLFSRQFVEEKVEILKGELWTIAFLHVLASPIHVISLGFFSYVVDWSEINRRIKKYKSIIGLPDESSHEFTLLKPEFQERLKSICEYAELWKRIKENGFHFYEARCQVQKILEQSLGEMKDLSFDILDDFAKGDDQA